MATKRRSPEPTLTPPPTRWEPPAGLRVALVHDWLNGMRGGEKVLEQFCTLFPSAHVYTLVAEPDRLTPQLHEMDIRELQWFGTKWLRRNYRKALPLLPSLIKRLPTAGYDLVVATSHCVAKAAPPPREGIMAAYVFSPMRYVWDHFEDYLGGGAVQDTALRLVRSRMQRWDAGSNDGIDLLAADSTHIAQKLRRYWNRPAQTIHPPVDLKRFQPNGKAPEDFFLVVSALVPYKRVDLAIRAARMAKKRLVIIGDGPERARLEARAGRQVEFLGWVPDEELAGWYARCRALLYPQTEDYGITALESQACGRPVIAYGAGGALETVVDGESGVFFGEQTPRALAERLRGHEDERWDSARIRALAERFSPLAFNEALRDWIGGEARLRW